MTTRGGPRVGLRMLGLLGSLCLACQLVSPGEGGLKLPSGLKPPALPIEPRVGDGDGDGTQVGLPGEAPPLPSLPPMNPGTGDGTGTGTGPAPRPRPWLKASFYAGVSPQGLAVGDFDEDGAPDVVINAGGRNFQNEWVARTGEFLLLRNDGAGRLERKSAPSPQTSSGHLAVADVDGDKHQDVILGTRQGLRLLRGTGKGTLWEQPPREDLLPDAVSSLGVWLRPTGGNPMLWLLTHAQEPLPGQARMLVAHIPSQGFWPYLPLKQEGEPVSPVPKANDATTQGVVADFDEDGLPDVVLEQAPSGRVILQVLLNTSIGVFVPGVSLSDIPPLSRLAAVDLDQDGHMDLLGLAEDTLRVFSGNGHGNFRVQPPLPLGAIAQEFAVVDYDGDGRLDVVALHTASAEVSLLRGVPRGAPLPHARMPVGRAPTTAAVADLDRDGTLELLITEADDNAVSVYNVPPRPPGSVALGPASPRGPGCPLAMEFPRPSSVPALSPWTRLQVGPGDASVLAAGDFDGDGKRDLALTRREGVLLLFNHRDGSFLTQTLPDTLDAAGLSAGDFDGDGRLDLAVQDSQALTVVWNDPRQPFRERTRWPGARSPLVGDFDGDGRTDLATSFPSDGCGGRRFMSLGRREFRAESLNDYNPAPGGLCGSQRQALAGDYNGDGTLDLVHVSFGLNLNPTAKDGSGLPGQGFQVQDTGNPQDFWSVDVTGDGKPDVVSSDRTPLPSLVLYPGDGHGSLLAPYTCGSSLPGPILAWQDVNDDGLLDLLGMAEDGRSIWTVRGKGPGQWHDLKLYGLGGLVRAVLAVDLLGDAQSELAVVTNEGELLVFFLP